MRRLYLSLLIAIAIVQSALCGFNSVSSNIQVGDLEQLEKIATTLDKSPDIVGILHRTGHSTLIAGNFEKKLKFLDDTELSADGASNGFIVEYNDRLEKVLAGYALPDVTISKLSKRNGKYVITGMTHKVGEWCGAETIEEGKRFMAAFELAEGKFTCISVFQPANPVVFSAADAYAEIGDGEAEGDKTISVTLSATKVVHLQYQDSELRLLHLAKIGANYILLGGYKSPGKITVPSAKKDDTPFLTLLKQNGLFVILIQADKAVKGVTIETDSQEIDSCSAQVTGDRVVCTCVINGKDEEIVLPGELMVKLSDNGIFLFDLKVQPQDLTSTWAAAYPFKSALRDVFVLNNYIFLLHDQVTSSLPFSSARNVAVSVLDMASDNKYTLVHGVGTQNLTAAAITVDDDALLVTAVQDNRGAWELMLSETSLPAFMTRKPIVEPPPPVPPTKPPVKPEPISPPPVPVPVPVPAPVPVKAPTPAPTPTEDKPVAVPVDAVPKGSEPKPEVVSDTTTFSTSYVVIAAVILVSFLGYVGFRFWKQRQAERSRQYGRVRMEDRIREENEFYNP